jgi:hypothetical protein
MPLPADDDRYDQERNASAATHRRRRNAPHAG